MKILKYILLLLFLVFVASSILVATLKPDYKIIRTRVINAPKITVFNYVNDYKNWAEFGTWKKDDATMKFQYPKNTVGLGSYYSWIGKDGEGKMKTIFLKNQDSIHQKMNYNGADSDVFWSFKEINGKTKVTWSNVGKMDFLTKIFTTLFGGMDNLIGTMYEKSLANIDKNLKVQTNTFVIKVNGFEEKNIGFYIQNTINSKNANIESNIEIMIPNLLKYLKENKIATSGKPFVKYNGVNDSLKITNFSVGVQVKDSVKIDLPSKIRFSNMQPFQAIKTTLVGEYLNKIKARIQALDLITKNNLIEKTELPVIEFYNISKTNQKNPSKWVTEIYIPVKLKVASKKYYKPAKTKPENSNPQEISSPVPENMKI
ncbi:MAG: SRPBCC family protein [Flavobacterium sp.]|nr:SRPBCC family protein [Flavobacterium sp.]